MKRQFTKEFEEWYARAESLPMWTDSYITNRHKWICFKAFQKGKSRGKKCV